jgi:glucose/arabinose dehydrogenase
MVRLCTVLVALIFVPAAASAQLRVDTYASGFLMPLEFVQDPSTPSVQYVVEQGGAIRVIQNGSVLSTPFVNLSGAIACCGEQGLLGLAFPPDYATSGRFYVDFTDTSGNTVVARFRRSTGNPLVADASTRFDFLWISTGERFIRQPFANHNGGHLAFGPDGYLYVALGDGGSGDDPLNNSQNPASLLGKLLRINVSVPDANPNGYVIPGDNPFVDGMPIPAFNEIWAFGVRNPWKFTFDDPSRGGSGAMLIGDVGQGSYEEVDYQPPGVGGRNYGWRNREGAHAHIGSPAPAYQPLIDPISEYDHSVGNSITGGVVYRGLAMGSMYRGRYFFADFVRGRVFSIALSPAPGGEVTASAAVEHTAELGGTGRVGNISAFGVDASGEMYLVSYSAGTILKVSVPQYPLAVAIQGSGTVTSLDGAISCPSSCSKVYPSGEIVTLDATPAPGFVFGGWSASNCSSTSFFMDGAHSCGATFLPSNPGGSRPGSVSLSGSGFGDVLTYNPRTGIHASELSDGQRHFGEVSGAWPAGLQVYAADFNNDGLTDFLVSAPAFGLWSKAINDGAGGFTYVNGQWSAGWNVYIVDLNGDHRSDAFVWNPTTGAWSRCVSTGTGVGGFACSAPGQWPTGVTLYPTDLNADGLADFFAYNVSTGQWSQAINNGVSYMYRSGQWPAGLTLIAGDFNGDGRGDFFAWNPATGAWSVVTTLPTLDFAYASGMWSVGWTFTAGDFDGDGKTDLFLYHPALGAWYEAISNGLPSSFTLTAGMWSANWQVQAADFNSDGHADLLLYNPPSGQWYQAVNAGIGSFTYGTGFWDRDLALISRVPRTP